jgi:hypothetical protein
VQAAFGVSSHPAKTWRFILGAVSLFLPHSPFSLGARAVMCDTGKNMTSIYSFKQFVVFAYSVAGN